MLQRYIHEPDNRIWYILWNIELKSHSGTLISNFSFKGPSKDEMVELGYGLKESYCVSSYMIEIEKSISKWALTLKKVTRAEAETSPENKTSQKVLINAGFILTGKYGDEGPRYLFI